MIHKSDVDQLIQDTTQIPHLDLGLDFDVNMLLKEYQELEKRNYFKPYESKVSFDIVKKIIKESWHGLSLLSGDGELHSDLNEDSDFYNKKRIRTIAAELSPYMMSVVNTIGSENQRIRVMKILPGGHLTWHSHYLDNFIQLPVLEYITVHVPIIAPKKFKYSVISLKDFRLGDIERDGIKVYSENYKAGRAHMFNCFHYHNVFNHDTEARVSLMLYLNLYEENTFEIVKKAVSTYEGPRIIL
jgi:Aspartyl/Asparaginyl beta-hydroxylase